MVWLVSGGRNLCREGVRTGEMEEMEEMLCSR